MASSYGRKWQLTEKKSLIEVFYDLYNATLYQHKVYVHKKACKNTKLTIRLKKKTKKNYKYWMKHMLASAAFFFIPFVRTLCEHIHCKLTQILIFFPSLITRLLSFFFAHFGCQINTILSIFLFHVYKILLKWKGKLKYLNELPFST